LRARLQLLLALGILPCSIASPAPAAIPSSAGTVWQYETSEAIGERGAGTILLRIGGPEAREGKELLRLDTVQNDELKKTDFVTVEDRGVLSHRRTVAGGKSASFNPPCTLLLGRAEVGESIQLADVLTAAETQRQCTVAAIEEVTVPAGTFQAYRVRCEEPWPVSLAVECWYAPAAGLVKQTASTRGPGGRLLQRVTTVLTKLSLGETGTPSPPPVTAAALPPRFTLAVAEKRDGEPVGEFKSDTPNIFVTWRGENLPVDETVRLAWVAEDVGDIVDPNFIVDQTETVVTTPEFGARFTLSRPKDGWAPGKYRLELYLEDTLMETVNVTIRE